MTWKQFSRAFRFDPIIKGLPEALVILLHDLGSGAARLNPLASRWAEAVPTTAFISLNGIEQLDPACHGSTELDRAATGVGMHHDFRWDGVSQAQIIRRGHAVDKHPRLVASPDGVDDRARIGRVGFLGELVEARLIVKPAIDPPEGFGLRQPLQRLIDGVPRGEIDEITGRPDLARRVRTHAVEHGCLEIG